MHNPQTGVARHRLVVCTTCGPSVNGQKPGSVFMREFRRELDAAGLSRTDPGGFDVVGEACLAGCDHPCTVACLAADKTSYLFGGFQTSGDIAAMIAFARQYSQSETGWTRSQDRPSGLKGKILARLPVFGASPNLADEGVS